MSREPFKNKCNMTDKNHPEYYCNDCGHPNITWYAPNKLWNQLCKIEEIICPKCFQGRADKNGINVVFTTEVIT